jgi:L,D-transpeptidase ErfK/SrfK
MTRSPGIWRSAARLAVVTLLAPLAACSLLVTRKPEPVAPPAAVAEPAQELAPLATHRFELDSDHDDVVGVVQLVTTSKDDTFSDIARRFDLGYEEMVRANPGVDPWVPGAGRVVVVPTQFILPNAPRQGVVINVSAMRLYYFPPHEPGARQVVYTHPIGIGRVGWKTPEGVTRVVRKQKDPQWRPTASIRKEHAEEGDPLPAVVAAGADNPLGRSAMYLGWPSYLIHGTNRPYGVGLRSSHGCIRLYNEDVDRLYEQIPVGTAVRVVNQPLVFGWHADSLYVQADGVLEDDRRGDWSSTQKLLQNSLSREVAARATEVDWEAVANIAHDSRGIPIPIAPTAVTLEELLAGARKVENRIPDGANWDGKVELAVDAKEFQDMLSESDPATAPRAASPSASPSVSSDRKKPTS